jgi:DNA polymerase-4
MAGVSARRAILHADLDAFFASVEQMDRPEWRGRPVLVGGSGPRAVVAAASYEARRFGCRSAMPMRTARGLCPAAVIARPRMARYAELSRRFMGILGDHSPLVQALSIDEAFVDVTGTERLFGGAVQVAESIRARVRREVGVTCSIGVAPTMMVAKIASDMRKPDGLTVIDAAELPGALAGLPIERMWGVGPATAAILRGKGVACFGDLQRLDRAGARTLIGEGGESLWDMAHGIDGREVRPERDVKSIGHEETFDTDLPALAEAHAVLARLVESVGTRLRTRGLACRTITVKIRSGDFTTVTRRVTLPSATDRTDAIWVAARDLLSRWALAGFVPLRLVGVSVSGLAPHGEGTSLFRDAGDERARRLDAARDAAARKFGKGAIGSAVTMIGTDETARSLPSDHDDDALAGADANHDADVDADGAAGRGRHADRRGRKSGGDRDGDR